MRITSIAVEVKETVSLPGYANTSHCVRYEAALAPDDNAEVSYGRLLALAKFRVYHEIDRALEREDEPPKFHMGDRFDVLSSSRLRDVAVVPSGYDAPTSWFRVKHGFTETKAKAFAEKYASGYGYAVLGWSEKEGLPSLAEAELTSRTRAVGPEPDYCENCHEPVSDLDPCHILCDDCYQPEGEELAHHFSCSKCGVALPVSSVTCGDCCAEEPGPGAVLASVPGEPDPGDDPICPKCDPSADLGRGHALCYAHRIRAAEELEEECGF